MSARGIPKAEQLPIHLRETLQRVGRQQLELAAGVALGALIGVIEGGRNGYYAIHADHYAEAHKFDELENYANNQPHHND